VLTALHHVEAASEQLEVESLGGQQWPFIKEWNDRVDQVASTLH
jgi:hypothetical protein